RAIGQYFGTAAQHDPGEFRPILIPAIDGDCDGGVLHDVAQALERNVTPLRLFVDGDVERRVGNRVADGHDVRYAARVGGGEVCHAAGIEKAALGGGEHAKSSVAEMSAAVARARNQTGIRTGVPCRRWIPAFAEMTKRTVS